MFDSAPAFWHFTTDNKVDKNTCKKIIELGKEKWQIGEYVPGKTDAEKQHVHEHETLQILQKLALNGKTEEFHDLLKTIKGADKKRDIILMCDM